MKLVVVSDSHGNTAALANILEREKPFDFLVHCGDGARDLAHLALPGGAALVRVSGNVDRAYGIELPVREFLQVQGFHVMATHGDRQRAHTDLAGLYDEAKTYRADIVLFGHTHLRYLGGERPWLFNPGAAQQGLYGVIVITDRVEFFHKRWEAGASG
jgi:uncharacterized protein